MPFGYVLTTGNRHGWNSPLMIISLSPRTKRDFSSQVTISWYAPGLGSSTRDAGDPSSNTVEPLLFVLCSKTAAPTSPRNKLKQVRSLESLRDAIVGAAAPGVSSNAPVNVLVLDEK